MRFKMQIGVEQVIGAYKHILMGLCVHAVSAEG